MSEAAVRNGELAVRRWVAGTRQSGLRVAVFLLAPFVFVLSVGPFLPDWLRIVPQEWSAPFVGLDQRGSRSPAQGGDIRPPHLPGHDPGDRQPDRLSARLRRGHPGRRFLRVDSGPAVDRRHRAGDRSRLVSAGPPARHHRRDLLRLYGDLRQMGTVDGHPVGGPGSRADCRRDRGRARHRGLQETLVRDPAVADPQRHAGPAAFLLHDPGRDLYRHRPQGGHDRHDHLRLPGDGAADHPGPQGGVAGSARGRHHGRLHEAPDAVEGRAAGSAADP